ncbi:YeiH family protein [Dehalobacterium formicoaceticum]|uniref:YeiH family protein n=1 Tax=Dehalobacterium formicoaceticum TaxID=51515 RepID=A0ABT1Y5C1_9FIRM|nr:putative sulfate exporter family transporter [Dehalobacterium formicoaceticum]MCR6545335.1 YeiH family protein [Dehalobacterium formicoaceticum]
MSSEKRGLSFLLKHEDYWAIWLGAFILLLGLVLFFANPPADMNQIIADSNAAMEAEADRAPFKTVAWYDANSAKAGLKGSSAPVAKTINNYLKTPGSWDSSNPGKSFILSENAAEAKRTSAAADYEAAKAATTEAKETALLAEEAAAAAGFADDALNQEATTQIAAWQDAKAAESKAKTAADTKSYNYILTMIVLMVFLGLLFSIGRYFIGDSARKFLIAFPAVFLVAVLSFFLGNHEFSKAWGIEYVLWAILLGILVSNTIGTPKWIMPAVQTEYYIKTGLVMLGATILMNKIMLIGPPGIIVTWGVTPFVLILTFIFGQKVLKMESATLNMVISADMSVSGVSAAIAASAACRAKKEELALAIGISMVFTAIMMVLMPLFIKAVGLNQVVGGAWLGGTIDSTGAVVAAGELLGPVARDVAATIKMIQNILIGVMAFGIAAYWTLVVDKGKGTESAVELSAKGALREIWIRFPKFVLGFLGASILFSIVYAIVGTDTATVIIDNGLVSTIGSLQKWFFALAFASIGLSTNFREFGQYLKGGKPLILYVVGQTFSLGASLTMCYLMFTKVFPHVTEALLR